TQKTLTIIPITVGYSWSDAPDCGTNLGWRKNNNICYYHNDTDIVDFHTAMTRCYHEKASLVSIHSGDEQAYVNTMVDLELPTWIGLSDILLENHSYSWTDGWPVFFTQWGPGEPSNIKDEGCVSVHASRAFHGTWNDTRCDQAKPYVCKISSG
uniref:C-type lectin domain-containing protein n=1 Tax=Cyclopterus lumpus TaxID=8103 RepID=A0A8C2WF37_CYCLU